MEGRKWAAVASSIVGDLHIKKNLPNQDAIAYYKLPGKAPAFVMAISDGHGSDKCPRSDVGSALAVNTAVKIFIDAWSVMQPRLDHTDAAEKNSALLNIERHIRKDITKQLVDDWIGAVETHSSSCPFQVEKDLTKRLLAYGATLTVVFLCEHFAVCMQLGDCEVLIVNTDMRVNRIIPRSNEYVGEDTDSLCMPNADKRFSVSFRALGDTDNCDAKLYLVCSDGFEKAFESKAAFEKSAIDFAKLVFTARGLETVENELESWLREYSNYSGDDVSVGLLFEKNMPAEPSVLGESIDKIESMNCSATTDSDFKEDFIINRSEIPENDLSFQPDTNNGI